MIFFAAYLVGAIWGVTEIKEGLEKRNTANYDSYSVQYYDMDDAYFKKHAFVISVVISGGPNLDFSKTETQEQSFGEIDTSFSKNKMGKCFMQRRAF